MDDKVTTSAVDQENRVLADLPEPETPTITRVEPAPYEETEAGMKAAGTLPPFYRVDSLTGKVNEITRSEYKEYQRKHVTRTYQTVPMCGHKFVPGEIPRHVNCEPCWFTFFQVHGELTQAVEEVYQKPNGAAIIKQLRGKKFLRNFLKFMASVAQLQETLEAAQAAKENNVTGTIRTDLSTGVEGEIDTASFAEEADASRDLIERKLAEANQS